MIVPVDMLLTSIESRVPLAIFSTDCELIIPELYSITVFVLSICTNAGSIITELVITGRGVTEEDSVFPVVTIIVPVFSIISAQLSIIGVSTTVLVPVDVVTTLITIEPVVVEFTIGISLTDITMPVLSDTFSNVTVPVYIGTIPSILITLVTPVLFTIVTATVQLSSFMPIWITTLSFCVPLYDSVSMIIQVRSVSVIVSKPELLRAILVVA